MDNQTTTEHLSRWQQFWLGLLILWLVLRLAFSIPAFREPERAQLVEVNTYVELATSMLTRGTYDGYSYENMDQVRTPVYPAFLYVILRLFSGNLAAVSLTQVLLTAVTCLAVYLAAARIASPGLALLAAWLYALDPNSLFVALVALTETLFAFMLAVSILSMFVFRQSRSWRWGLLSAGALGLAVLTRPIGAWLIPLWALFAAFPGRKTPWRGRLGAAGLFLITASIVLLPWQLRNQIIHGEFGLSPVSNATIRNWMVAEGLAEARGITRNEAAAEISTAEDPWAYSLELVRQYPGAMAIASAKGIYRTVMGFEFGTWTYLLGGQLNPSWEFLDSLQSLDLASGWTALRSAVQNGQFVRVVITLWGLDYTLLIFLLAALGTLRLLRSQDRTWHGLFLVLVCAYLILAPTGAGQARFRVPAAPALAILAAFGGSWIWGVVTRRKAKGALE